MPKRPQPIDLKVKRVVELFPKAPFNFDATLHKPDHFSSADNDWGPGVRWQTMLWQNRVLGLKFENQGTIEQPSISLCTWSDKALDEEFLASLETEVNYRCDLQLEMQALFETYGTLLAYDGKQLYCFWEPDVVDRAPEQELRGLKVGYRAKSIKRVTGAFAKKEIDEFELRNQLREEQRQALLGLYGIGPASVGYILFDVFHHLGELNHISPWEQKIYSKLFFDSAPDEPVPVDQLLHLFDERFGKYKMLAVHYVWEDLFWKRNHLL